MDQPSPSPQAGADVPGATTAHTGSASRGPLADAAAIQAVAGRFTVRDITVFGSTLVLLIVSLIPMFEERYNLWNLGNLFLLGLGIILPVIVTALFLARRLQPNNVVRIGSLSTDQFASVVASFTLAFFFLATVETFSLAALFGLIGALGLLAATVLGPHLPYLSADFKGRAETPAHPVARESAVPEHKPVPLKKLKKPMLSRQSKQPEPGPVAAGAPREGVGHMPGAAAVPAAGATPAAGVGATPGAAAMPASGVVPPAGTSGEAAGMPAAAAKPTTGVVPPASGEPGTQAQVPAQTQAGAFAAKVPAGEGTGPASETGPADRVGAATGGAATDLTPPTMATPKVTYPPTQIGATVDPSSRPEESENGNNYEAFWFAVPQPRTAVDEKTGAPVFIIEPGGWVLALEDRGHEFLVQNTDGRLGVLRDLTHVERG